MRSQNIKYNSSGKVGGISCLVLLLLTFLAINPISDSSVYAEEDGDYGIDTQTLIPSTVGISFSSGSNGSCTNVAGGASCSAIMTPIDASGAKARIDIRATVTVQNSGGYSVYIGSDSSQLKNSITNTTIDSVSQDKPYAYAELPINRWGYSFNKVTNPEDMTVADAYVTMPATARGLALDSHLNDRIKGEEKRYYNLSFAANIDASMPAGTYSNQVTMSVVSSPLEIGLMTIKYMQDMTSEICKDSTVGDTARLIDKRDGKKYWVTKLKDNNCWMTQNLDLDIPAGGFTSNSTDVGVANSYSLSDMSSAWSDPTAVTTSMINSSTVSSVATDSRSWDQNLYVLNTPKAGTNCGNNTAGQDLSTSGCQSAGFVNVSNGYTASDDPDFTAKNGSPINEETKTYDAHYLVGNWYQWNAAVAGTGGAIKSSAATESGMVNATSSICPKGWHLPTSGGTANNKPFNQNDSFGALLKSYGGNGDSSTVQSNIETNTLTEPPFFLVRSGFVNGDGYITNSGIFAGYRSATAGTDAGYTYTLEFYTGAGVSPSYSSLRSLGLPVRCLAR